MTEPIKQTMRIILLLLLFQFVAPVFISVVTLGADTNEDFKCAYHEQHNSIVIPQLLKETDETDSKEESLVVNLITLIDFTDHVSVLTESHETKITPINFRDQFDLLPPLFTLHRAFLI